VDVESFHGRFRDECLNGEQLHTLTEARVVIGDYGKEYNQSRPHSRLSYLSPAAFPENDRPSPAPVGDGPSAVHQQPATTPGMLTSPRAVSEARSLTRA
jgi:Integrase core domain